MKMEQLININIVNIKYAQHGREDLDDDCEINVGIEEGDQGNGMFAARCQKCNLMNQFPVGMNNFKCSRCGENNLINKKE